jgi:hypothetical protein
MLIGKSQRRFGKIHRKIALIVLIVSGILASVRFTSEVLAHPALEPPVQTGGLVPEPGFPVSVTGSVSAQGPAGPYINTLAANIDADPRLELVNAIPLGGPLGAWNHDGTPGSSI